MGLPETISMVAASSASRIRGHFQLFLRMTINLQLSKLASDVSCVTVQHRSVSSTDLA